MTNIQSAARKKQAGFTLVELAVVMIIIGLLIGGVLKGQELVANAQITGTASSVKGIDAATTTFRDTFAALPGDMLNANNRLQNCAAAPCLVAAGAGVGNGRIDTSGLAAAPGVENVGFWSQLSAADLISGVNSAVGGNAWGANFPAAPIAGGFHAAYHAGAALGANPTPRAGHYLILNNNPGAAPASNALTALQAARLDRKLDDGNPTTGTVFPVGATCVAAGAYNESGGNTTCDVVLRFQN